jgi:acetate kinase
MEKEKMCCTELNDLINKRSGMLGITGVSSDMRNINQAANDGNSRAELGLQLYAYTVRKYIGAYAAVLNGVDLVLFTGGIGENDYQSRERILKDMDYLGLDFDANANAKLIGVDGEITKPGSKVVALVVGTNEELVIASDTFDILSKP